MNIFLLGACSGALFILLLFFLRNPMDRFRARVHSLKTPPSMKTDRSAFADIPELDRRCVEDVMVPRSDIAAINLDDRLETILEQLRNAPYARLPAYTESFDNVAGILHLRMALAAASREPLTKARLRELVEEPYFIPEATPLQAQLLAFQEVRKRAGLVVDEYGDIQGLVTLDDILEEIVGEFTTDPNSTSSDITREAEGSFLVGGGIAIRSLNRALNMNLPTEGPKTLNGLILETLETIPQPNTSVRIDGHPLEVVQTTRNAVRAVRLRPAILENGHVADKPDD